MFAKKWQAREKKKKIYEIGTNIDNAEGAVRKRSVSDLQGVPCFVED